MLKEYDSSLSEGATSVTYDLTYNDQQLTYNGNSLTYTTTIVELIKSKGCFKGISPVAVLDIALQWWDRELSELERIN